MEWFVTVLLCWMNLFPVTLQLRPESQQGRAPGEARGRVQLTCKQGLRCLLSLSTFLLQTRTNSGSFHKLWRQVSGTGWLRPQGGLLASEEVWGQSSPISVCLSVCLSPTLIRGGPGSCLSLNLQTQGRCSAAACRVGWTLVCEVRAGSLLTSAPLTFGAG